MFSKLNFAPKIFHKLIKMIYNRQIKLIVYFWKFDKFDFNKLSKIKFDILLKKYIILKHKL